MELIPKEKQRIHEEEKARLDTLQKKLQRYICILTLILIAISIVVIAFFPGLFNKMDHSSSNIQDIHIGSEAKLYKDNGDQIPLASDKETYEEMIRAAAIKDEYGWKALILDKRIFLVNSETKILILDSKDVSLKVRILEGNLIRQEGWVSSDTVKPLNY